MVLVTRMINAKLDKLIRLLILKLILVMTRATPKGGMSLIHVIHVNSWMTRTGKVRVSFPRRHLYR